MCLWGVSPWSYLVWDSLGFLDLGGYFLPHFREVFNYYLLKYFLMPFLFVFFFWDSCDSNVGVLNIVPEVSEVVLISFNSFFIFSSLLHLFPPFYLPPHLSCLLPQLFCCWLPLECFDLIYCIIHYWLFFISSRSLLNISCIFSILVSSLFIYNSILFSRYWIICTIIILNSFQVDSLSPPLLFGLVGIYHVPLPAEYFSAFTFCLDFV